jgi:hypothetical protein
LYIEEALTADISGDIRLTASNMTKSKVLDTISGITPLIFKEILVFPEISGNSQLIFQTQ